MPMHWQVNRPRWRRKCPQQLEQHNRGLSQSKENRLHTSTRLTSSSTYSASSTAIAATDGMADILSIATLRCSFSNSGCACGSSDSYSMASEASSSSSEAWGRKCKQRHAPHCLNTVAAGRPKKTTKKRGIGHQKKSEVCQTRSARRQQAAAHTLYEPSSDSICCFKSAAATAASLLPAAARQTWTAG